MILVSVLAMLHLHYSNRFEDLISPLQTAVRTAQREAPLERVTIVVPNRAIDEYLKLRLAERDGIAANLYCPFLRRYLGEVIHKAVGDLRILDLKELQVVIFEFLRGAVGGEDSDFNAVRSYIGTSHSRPRQSDLKLFLLSERVAWLFREYSILRGAMLKRWLGGLESTPDSADPSEVWQRRIWTALFNADGALKANWMIADQSNPNCRWMMLPDAIAALDSEQLRRALPTQLHIFGLSYVGAEFLKIFGRLASLIDLQIYTLNPCQEFWEDVSEQRTTTLKPRSAPRPSSSSIDQLEDQSEFESSEDNLALRHWGRAGREYIRLLNEITDYDFRSHFTSPLATRKSNSLLAEVQNSILLRQPETALPANYTGPDESIRFLLCPGVRREVEIIANAIWSVIRNDNEPRPVNEPAQRLRFHQIAVIMPDSSRDTYISNIEAVFAQAHRIPLNIVERRANAESRVIEAVELLLKLPLGRFGRNDLTRLLTHPAVAGELSEEDSAQWSRWCRSLGIYFGADETAFLGTYISPNLYHWDQALKRLALGLFMENGTSSKGRVFSTRGTREFIPFEVPEDAMGAAMAMIRTARRLLCNAMEVAQRDLPLPEWSSILSTLVSRYIHPSDRAGERIRDSVLGAIDSMAPTSLISTPVSYEIAVDIALKQIASAESEHYAYTESGVVAGSFSALHSIPFRVIFMLGMGEMDFPERARRDTLDLRRSGRNLGDVSPTERDRYIFLETLLAARDRVFISYVSRNTVTGDQLEPSPVVRDLQLILRRFAPDSHISQLSVQHPACSYDRRYFHDLANPEDGEHAQLVSFDHDARRGAQIAALRDDLEERCGQSQLASDEPLLDRMSPHVREQLRARLRFIDLPRPSGLVATREILLPIGALRRYLECPLQGAARYALGLFEQEDGDDQETDEEPLDQDALNRTMSLREALWSGRGNRDRIEAIYRQSYTLRELKGDAPTGPFARAAQERDLAKLRLGLAQAAMVGIANLDGWQQVALGGADEFSEIDRTLPEIAIEIDATRADNTLIHIVNLHGRVGPVSADSSRWLRCVAGKKAKPTDFLDGFLTAIVLSAAGETMPLDFLAIAVGGDDDGENIKKFSRSFKPPTQAKALEYLGLLTRDLLSDQNHYFLPIEAVREIISRGLTKDREIQDAVEGIRDNEFASCRSDFGPVADARSFPSYPPRDVSTIINRRFGLLKAIFEK
jgi:exodeoxyribonuclease V gamma subunit